MSVFRRTGMTTVAVLVGIVLVLVAVVAARRTGAAGPGWACGTFGPPRPTRPPPPTPGTSWKNNTTRRGGRGRPGARGDEAAAADRRHELEDQHDRLWEQVAAGDRVVERLAGGQTTLADAVPELEHINADRPGFVVGLRCHHKDRGTISDRQLVAVY